MDKKPYCISCNRSAEEVPLLVMIYRGESAWICPQHLPILIHEPGQLAGKLPGVEKLTPPSVEHSH